MGDPIPVPTKEVIEQWNEGQIRVRRRRKKKG